MTRVIKCDFCGKEITEFTPFHDGTEAIEKGYYFRILVEKQLVYGEQAPISGDMCDDCFRKVCTALGEEPDGWLTRGSFVEGRG